MKIPFGQSPGRTLSVCQTWLSAQRSLQETDKQTDRHILFIRWMGSVNNSFTLLIFQFNFNLFTFLTRAAQFKKFNPEWGINSWPLVLRVLDGSECQINAYLKRYCVVCFHLAWQTQMRNPDDALQGYSEGQSKPDKHLCLGRNWRSFETDANELLTWCKFAPYSHTWSKVV